MTEFAKHQGASKILLAVCVGMLSAAPAVIAQESVTAVRYWSLGDVTRIAVEATGGFGFRSDRLANPDRVYFDLPGTVPALEHKGINTITVGDQFVRQIRVAETQRGTTRIVLDLVTSVEITTSVLSTITINDLMSNAENLASETFRPFETYLVVLVLYWLATFAVSAIVNLASALWLRRSADRVAVR